METHLHFHGPVDPERVIAALAEVEKAGTVATHADNGPEPQSVVLKSDPERQFVLGVAFQAGWDDGITKGADGYRDFVGADELELTAWGYLAKGQEVGLFHADGTEGHATVVESYIWRGDPWQVGDVVVKAGDWLVGALLDDVAWDLYKRGQITGWSPQGGGRRIKPRAE